MQFFCVYLYALRNYDVYCITSVVGSSVDFCLLVWDFVVNLAGKYFDEISQDSGRYCFGVQETLKALEMGAVEILIVWENLEVIRYVLKNNTTTGK